MSTIDKNDIHAKPEADIKKLTENKVPSIRPLIITDRKKFVCINIHDKKRY